MLKLDQFVVITGGTDAMGMTGQISDLDDPVFVGVRVPDRGRATETIYVTRGSVEPIVHGQSGETRGDG